MDRRSGQEAVRLMLDTHALVWALERSAHALEEQAALVTRDRDIARYQVPIVW
jgi:PIN domain nuclease of toxin-antitoxin system